MKYSEEIENLKKRCADLERKLTGITHSKITIEEFITCKESLSVYCASKEQTKKLCQTLGRMNFTWRTGVSYFCEGYQEGNIYFFNSNAFSYNSDPQILTYNFDDIIFPTEPVWYFSDKQKNILKLLPEEFKWLKKKPDERMFAYCSDSLPRNNLDDDDNEDFDDFDYEIWSFGDFGKLFTCIDSKDDEFCEFRKFL